MKCIVLLYAFVVLLGTSSHVLAELTKPLGGPPGAVRELFSFPSGFIQLCTLCSNLIVAAGYNSVVGFDLSQESIKWKIEKRFHYFACGSKVLACVTVGDRRDTIFFYDVTTGALRLKRKIHARTGRVLMTRVFGKDTLFCYVWNDPIAKEFKDRFWLEAYDMKTGEHLWSKDWEKSTLINGKNESFYASCEDSIERYSVKTGKLTKKYAVGCSTHLVDLGKSLLLSKLINNKTSLQLFDKALEKTTWSRKTTFSRLFRLLVVKHLAYFGARDGSMCCVNLQSGTFIWKTKSIGCFTSKPRVYNDKIIFSSHDGTVVGLNKASGKLLWSLRLASRVSQIPELLIHKDKAIVAEKHAILSIGLKQNVKQSEPGSRIWTYRQEYLPHCSSQHGARKFQSNLKAIFGQNIPLEKGHIARPPLILDSGLVVIEGGRDCCMVSLDCITGKRRWWQSGYNYRVVSSTKNSSKIVVARGHTVLCLNASSGEEYLGRKFTLPGDLSSTFLTQDNLAYCVCSHNRALCFNILTGKLVWQRIFDKEARSCLELGHKLLSPISFGDVVCFPISGLGLVILKKQTGQQVKRIRIKEELVSAVHSKNKLLLLGKRWFYVLEMPSGKPLWKTLVKGGDYHEMIQPNSNSCVIRSADGKSSFIHFVDTQNRRIAWRRRIEEKVVKIGCCGGSVYVITKSNFMLEIDPKRGLIRNKYFYPSLVPTSVGFSHDTMYFADYTGRFVAIKPEARLVCN